MKIVTAAQMRAIEARSEESGVSTDSLMEDAGLAVARIARRMVGSLTGVRVVVLVGPGNNGGDGLVTARHLQGWGARVTAYLCRDRSADDPKLADARSAGVRVVRASDDPHLTNLKAALGSAHLIVDAILGHRACKAHLRNSGRHPEDALRMSGWRTRIPVCWPWTYPRAWTATQGMLIQPASLRDVTVALGYPKRAVTLVFQVRALLGGWRSLTSACPPVSEEDVRLGLMTGDWARSALPERPPDSHKGTFGRAMIVAGSRRFLGAAYLAAVAAGRVGAGLVTIAIPESLVSSVAPRAIEPTFLPLPESSAGVVSFDAGQHDPGSTGRVHRPAGGLRSGTGGRDQEYGRGASLIWG